MLYHLGGRVFRVNVASFFHPSSRKEVFKLVAFVSGVARSANIRFLEICVWAVFRALVLEWIVFNISYE